MKSRHLITLAITVASLTLRAYAEPEESEAALKAEAKISEKAAQKVALAKMPNGKIAASEIERENGKLVWSFDFAMPGTRDITEIQVDAKTGEFVSSGVETAADQAKEKAEDQKANKD